MQTAITLIILGALVGVFLVARVINRKYRALRALVRQSESDRREVIDFMNDFSRSLGTVEEIDHGMQQVAHYLRDVAKAESLAIFSSDPESTGRGKVLRGIAVSGSFPAFGAKVTDMVMARSKHRLQHVRHEFIEFGEGIIGRVAEAQTSTLVTVAAEHPAGEEIPAGVDTLMAVPMFVEGHLEGVICAVNTRLDGVAFTESDVRMVENLAPQIAVAANLLAIYADRSKQARILQELELGREIQQSLLPADVPVWGNYEFGAFSRPALEVGGDYYDFVQIDDDRLMIVIADAAGKGVPACMLMATCRSFVRSLVEHYTGLERFLEKLNSCMFRDTDRAHFMTMAVIVIDKEENVCEYGNAGHTPLLLRTPENITRVVRPEGPALGLLPAELGLNFDTLSFCFHPGTSLMLFTDGLDETLSEDNEEYGIDRLRDLWHSANPGPSEAADIVLDAVAEFGGTMPQADDQTLIMVRLPGLAPQDEVLDTPVVES